MGKISRTKEDLENELREQLDSLVFAANTYDAGREIIAAKFMATTLRILLHSTSESRGLLGQLDMLETDFVDTAQPLHLPGTPALAMLLMPLNGAGAQYDSYLDDVPPGVGIRRVGFDEYWRVKPIIMDKNGCTFSREWLVKRVANEDGGAHVDPSLTRAYMELTRQNSMGWTSSSNGAAWLDVGGVGSASIRQIAHEVLRTFSPDYQVSKKQTKLGASIAISGLTFIPETQMETIRRQGPCPCGSSKKYKRCCGT